MDAIQRRARAYAQMASKSMASRKKASIPTICLRKGLLRNSREVTAEKVTPLDVPSLWSANVAIQRLTSPIACPILGIGRAVTFAHKAIVTAYRGVEVPSTCSPAL